MPCRLLKNALQNVPVFIALSAIIVDIRESLTILVGIDIVQIANG
jgi:hypothetical protein